MLYEEKENKAAAEWAYCVVGNIVKEHIDSAEIIRYGTPAFFGGTKVFLSGKHYDFNREEIGVLGLSRGNRYYVEYIPRKLIENIRLQRVFKPKVLSIMNDFEFHDRWWENTREDKKSAQAFIEKWNNEQSA